MVDMTKKSEVPKVAEIKEEAKEQLFNLSLTREEIDVIKQALAKSKDFEAFVSVTKGALENKILVDLESI